MAGLREVKREVELRYDPQPFQRFREAMLDHSHGRALPDDFIEWLFKRKISKESLADLLKLCVDYGPWVYRDVIAACENVDSDSWKKGLPEDRAEAIEAWVGGV